MNADHDCELDELCDIIAQRGVVRYLEIGSRNGISLWKIGQAVKRVAIEDGREAEAIAVAVDLPAGNWGTEGTDQQLHKVANGLQGIGLRTEVIIGDSHSDAIIETVRALAPFDLVYIDADHTYEGVLADWHAYGFENGIAGNVVALDDVLFCDGGQGPEPGVWRLWEEIRADDAYRTRLIAAAGSTQGIGVIWQRK